MADIVNFRGETFAQAFAQVVDALRASKGWTAGYAEAYVDELINLGLDAGDTCVAPTEAGRAMLRDAQQSSPDRQQGE